MNLNLRCSEILQMTKMASIINKNYKIYQDYQDSCNLSVCWVQQTDRLPNYIVKNQI